MRLLLARATCASCATCSSAPLLLCGRDVLEPGDLRFEGPGRRRRCPLETPGAEMHLTLEELEKVHIERVLREMGGRVAEASQRLGIPRSTLYQKIKKFSISLPRTP